MNTSASPITYCACKKRFTNRDGQPISEKSISMHRMECKEYLASVQLCASKMVMKRSKNGQGLCKKARLHSKKAPTAEDAVKSDLIPQPEHPLSPPVLELQAVTAVPTPTVEDAGRPKRVIRLPQRFRNITPPPVVELEDPASASPPPPDANLVQPQRNNSPNYLSKTNAFGVFRRYSRRPSAHELRADAIVVPDDMNEDKLPPVALSPEEFQKVMTKALYPFPNYSTFLYLLHDYDGISKSRENRERQIQNVFLDPHFKWEEFKPYLGHFNRFETALDRMDLDFEDRLGPPDAWHRTTLDITLPIAKVRGLPDSGVRQASFKIPGLQHRSITAVAVEALQRKRGPSEALHYVPYRQFWRTFSPDGSEDTERVVDDLYTSEAWLTEDAKIQLLPILSENGLPCSLPRALAGLMFWSDATQLANFGTAKLWPLYMFLGNQAKWHRSKPTAACCHHIAYLPSLPDHIQDEIKRHTPDGRVGKAPLMAHLRRELMHAIWDLLLDADLLAAWDEGLIVECGDGICRRIFLRIFTYSADYPEKALLATIRDNGTCPCPFCAVPKNEIYMLGTARDIKRRVTLTRRDSTQRQERIAKARELIFTKGIAVNGAAVEALLKDASEVPTINAFSNKLLGRSMDYLLMLVSDVMHEWDLGNWKDLFKFLVRLLFAAAPANVAIVNERYRLVPTFGNAAIRRFSDNAAETKNMAARDYEDLLQCAMPVFAGLFPAELDGVIQDVLFCAANWQFLAKLHVQSTSTVQLLEQCSKQYGTLLRKLRRATQHVNVVETPSEVRARKQRASGPNAKDIDLNQPIESAPSGPKPRPLNLNTVKKHLVLHTIESITRYGSTDSYSSRRGEMEHKTVKALYTKTNGRGFEEQIARRVRRIEQMRSISRAVAELRVSQDRTPDLNKEDSLDDNQLLVPAPHSRYHIGASKKDYIDVILHQDVEHYDYATIDFTRNMKNHILSRINHCPPGQIEPDYSDLQRSSIQFRSNRIYRLATLQLEYTTYDCRRAQDSIGVNGEHCDVFVAAGDADDAAGNHPYWYARVLCIFRAWVHHPRAVDTNGDQMDFLFVRWFQHDTTWRAGWKQKRLDRICFLGPSKDQFGFIDPSLIIRACHLIPGFDYGRTSMFIPGNSVYKLAQGDWCWYYVNRYADSDMAMRYTDLGIGHARVKKSKRLGSAQWGTPWANWEQDEDVQEAAEDLGLGLAGSDEESDSDAEDINWNIDNGDLAFA